MKRILGAALGVGALALVAAVLKGRSGGDVAAGGTRDTAADPQTDSFPLATGRDDTHDPLGTAHTMPSHEAKYVRAAARQVKGKNTSVEREHMYDDADEAVESGSMAHPTGQEDRNPIGPHK